MVRMRPGQRTRCSGAALISFLPKDLSRGTP
jgi:hypothetical protein